MFKPVLKISELRELLEEGIVCLVDTNDKNKIRFGFYTTNFELIENLEEDTSPLEDCFEDTEEHLTPAFNYLTRELEFLNMSIFTGRVFFIASVDAPAKENNEDELLKLNEGKFTDTSGYPAELLNIIDADTVQNLLFQVNEPDSVSIQQVDEYGKDKNDEKRIENADSRFTEHFGCIFMCKKSEPVWLSKDKIENVNLKGSAILFPTIAYVNSDGNPVHIRLLAEELEKNVKQYTSTGE